VILAGAYPELDTTNTENDSEMKKEVEERKSHSMAKVHDFLEMWQGSQILRAAEMESRAQIKEMTAVGYISDREEYVKASWSPFQFDGAAAFTLCERSPLLPPLSAKDRPGGRTQVFNVRHIGRINRHPVDSDGDGAPESVSDTEDWLHWNEDLDNPNESEDDWVAEGQCDIEPVHNIEDPDCPMRQHVSASPNVPVFIRPTRESERQALRVSMTVNAIDMRRKKGVKQRSYRMHQCFTGFFMYLELEFWLVIYYGRMMSSSLSISVDKQIYSSGNEAFRKIYKF